MINIIEAIENRLKIPRLQKIDPNNTSQRETRHPAGTDHFQQAAVTAVLAGLYKYGRTEAGAATLASGAPGNWLQTIFHGQDEEVVQRVARYGGQSPEQARDRMETVAATAAAYVREQAGDKPTPDKIKALVETQRHTILAYLPAELHLSQVLNDETIDDRTNKMDGPMSSFMHTLGSAFSASSDEERDTWNRDENQEKK